MEKSDTHLGEKLTHARCSRGACVQLTSPFALSLSSLCKIFTHSALDPFCWAQPLRRQSCAINRSCKIHSASGSTGTKEQHSHPGQFPHSRSLRTHICIRPLFVLSKKGQLHMSLSAIVEMGEMKRFHCNMRTVLRGILELELSRGAIALFIN
jgi:hypothetical protein